MLQCVMSSSAEYRTLPTASWQPTFLLDTNFETYPKTMKRRGFTLVELIAVMAVMVLVMGISVLLLVQVFDFQRNHYEYSDGVRTVDRFIADFRNDVRTYGKPEILADGEVLLRWKTESVTVDYIREPGSFPEQQNIARTVHNGGQQTLYERYSLPDRMALHITEGSGNDAGLIALSLWTAPQGTEVPELAELNPFDRTMLKSLEQRIDPKYASNWRTIIARYTATRQ